MKNFIYHIATVLSAFLMISPVCSQNPSYYCDIRNETFVSPDVFEFDLYISRTGSIPLELACFNAGVKLNSSFINGGTVSVEIISNSDLVSSQVPTSISYDDASACVLIAPQKPPRDYITGLTSGSVIEPGGSRVCGVRLTNSVSFGIDPATLLGVIRLIHIALWSQPLLTGDIGLNALITDSESNSRSAMASVFLEGLYFGGQNRKALDDMGEHFNGPVADKINISLAQATSPYDIVYTCNSVNLNTNGKTSFQVPTNLRSSYYVVINHRNSIETWSAMPVSFNDPVVNYDFTSDMASAYGNNMIEVNPGQWAVFAGDVNQDGVIDSGDFIDVDNGSFNYLSGYLAADVNGDGVVDSGDFISVDNNGFNYIGLTRPF